MSKRRLYLHIGNHKTGSTSIQSAMSRSEDPRIFNKLRPKQKASSYNSWYCNSWVFFEDDAEFSQQGYLSPDLAAELIAHNPEGDVIFSAEDMSWIFSPEPILRFANAVVNEFDEVKIIAYLRRQDRNAISLVQQASSWIKSRGTKFFGAIEGTLPEITPLIDEYFNFNHRIGLWADIFGDDAMIFRIFHELAEQGALVTSFNEITGLELEHTELHKRKSSPKSHQILNQRLIAMGAEVRIPREITDIMMSGRKMMPARARAEAFYAHYRESNIALNQRMKINQREAIFDEDFSEYPEHDDEIMSPEEGKQIMDALIMALMRVDAQRRIGDQRRTKLRRQINALKAPKK